jgi:hypothetical protein
MFCWLAIAWLLIGMFGQFTIACIHALTLLGLLRFVADKICLRLGYGYLPLGCQQYLPSTASLLG